MNDDIFNEWWTVILQKDARILGSYHLPLVNITDYVDYFNLSPLPPLKLNVDIISDIKSKQPSFKNLSEEILLALRQNIYTKTDIDTVALWAEKLMRFCEVQYSTLKKRAIEKWRDKSVARLHLLHLSVFLLDYSIHSKDLRFLNTVLKLAELRWILNRKTMRRDLKKEKEDGVCALFQFRIILMTEYAINQLRKGEMI